METIFSRDIKTATTDDLLIDLRLLSDEEETKRLHANKHYGMRRHFSTRKSYEEAKMRRQLVQNELMKRARQ